MSEVILHLVDFGVGRKGLDSIDYMGIRFTRRNYW